MSHFDHRRFTVGDSLELWPSVLLCTRKKNTIKKRFTSYSVSCMKSIYRTWKLARLSYVWYTVIVYESSTKSDFVTIMHYQRHTVWVCLTLPRSLDTLHFKRLTTNVEDDVPLCDVDGSLGVGVRLTDLPCGLRRDGPDLWLDGDCLSNFSRLWTSSFLRLTTSSLAVAKIYMQSCLI